MNDGPDDSVLLRVRDVRKHFRQLSLRGERVSRAVDGVSLDIQDGEILGVAGESGCGKSTLSRLICGLLPPSSGEIEFRGRDIRGLSGRDKKEFRRQVQMVFQDPEGSLNPRRRIGSVLQQPFQVHKLGSPQQQRRQVLALLERVKLTPPEYYASKFPYELSGGSKQRVAIARALALEPSLVLADEPVASLDMSIRGAILMLLRELKPRLGDQHRPDFPRPERPANHGLQSRHHVSGANRRDRDQKRGVLQAPSSLYASATLGEPHSRSQEDPRARQALA